MTLRFLSAGKLSTVLLLTLLATACQRHNSLVIEKGSPIRFVLSGRATINSLQVTGPDLQREPHPQGDGERLTLLKVYWEVAPRGEAAARTLDEIREIRYGEIPEGFVQVYPTNGTPSALVEKNLYCVSLIANSDRGFTTFFAIRDGKIVAEGED